MKSRELTTGASVVWVQRRRTRWHSRRESQRNPCQGLAAAAATGVVSADAIAPDYGRLDPPDNVPSVTREEVDRWLKAYVEAWRTYDRERIEALFAEDVSYRYHPADDPIE